MFWSEAFIPTLKEIPQEAESKSHQLMLRAGLIRQLISGVYSYLPLGLKVLHKIEKIIRQEMDSRGAQELLLSALQPADLWVRSGRDKEIGQVMFRFDDRRGRRLCLGPTHEEIITDLVKQNVFSYRQLPLILYQIQVKFRDEIRPRFGLVRSCEFIMKDAYSFDKDEKGLELSYDKMLDCYKSIFKKCGVDFLVVEADPGLMGGSLSDEFMVPAESGEDLVLQCSNCQFSSSRIEELSICPKCKKTLKRLNTIEVGHIFQLGTKYSKAFQANFLDRQGNKKSIIMGCYGIGVSRLISAIIEQNNDDNGICWPREVAPFEVIILPFELGNKKVYDTSLNMYKRLKQNSFEVILDDRDERGGVKFKDADLIGIPLQVILGRSFIKEGKVELKLRKDKKSIMVKPKDIVKAIKKQLLNPKFRR